MKVDAKRNLNSRGNHYVKNKNFSMLNNNFDLNKNGPNAVSGDRKPEMVTDTLAKQIASQIRCSYYEMLNHRKSECPKLQSEPNNCARVGLKDQRIRDNQFVIILYANDQPADDCRNSGA